MLGLVLAGVLAQAVGDAEPAVLGGDALQLDAGTLAAADAGSGLSVSATATGDLAWQSSSAGGSSLSPGLAARLDASKAMGVSTVRLRLAARAPSSVVPTRVVEDLGSWLELETRPWAGDGSLTFRLQPFTTTRLVTFDWANAQGRPLGAPSELAPVLSVDLRVGDVSAWAALRAVARNDPLQATTVVDFDAFLGAEVTWSQVRVEARAAALQFGLQPALAALGLKEDVWGLAGAARVTWDTGGGVDAPLDLGTYAQDPLRYERPFVPLRRSDTPVATTVSLEGGTGVERLASPDSPQAMTLQPSGYADVEVRLRLGDTRLSLVGRLATASHLQFDVPGLPPMTAISAGSSQTPKLSAYAGVDHTFRGVGLTPGVLARLDQGATLTRPASVGLPASAESLMLTETNVVVALPPGVSAQPDLSVKVTLRWAPQAPVCLLAELEEKWDWNQVPVSATGGSAGSRPAGTTTRAQLMLQGQF
jgi:hypothetical protein